MFKLGFPFWRPGIALRKLPMAAFSSACPPGYSFPLLSPSTLGSLLEISR